MILSLVEFAIPTIERWFSRVVDQRLHRLWGEEKQVVPPGYEIAISVVVVNLLQCRQDHPLVTSTREEQALSSSLTLSLSLGTSLGFVG